MIPEHLRTFLRAAVKSVWALDLLLLMKAAPAQGWTSKTLNDRLRASVSLVEEILATLKREGVVAEEAGGVFRYAPATPGTAQLVEELARLYAQRPVAVIKEIVSAPNEKIHSFVDAFRLKKD